MPTGAEAGGHWVRASLMLRGGDHGVAAAPKCGPAEAGTSFAAVNAQE